ncbi:MAG: glycosyltransferase family 2 protein [Muribaculaceae bacterium]|nr:glycosyltransferase family 2 protein [Muribaculaceae bacterium]
MMGHTPRSGICVVVPVYNRERAVTDMLDSLEQQSRMPDEVILIDNNSTDNSCAVITRWAEKMNGRGWNVSIISEKQPGASAARKTGENLISKPYTVFFDSDDTMHPDYLEAAMRDFEADPDLKLSVWNINFNHPDGSTEQRRLMPAHPLENHLVQGLLSTQAYAVRTDYLRGVGGWNPTLGGWDDWELGLRLLLGGGKFRITDSPRAEITVQEDSISGLSYLHRKGDWEKTMDEMESVLHNYDIPDISISPSPDSDVPDSEVKEDVMYATRANIRFALRLLAYRRAILAAHYRHEGDKAGGRQLLREALNSPYLNIFHRMILRGAYRLTCTGCRGAGYIFPRFLRK